MGYYSVNYSINNNSDGKYITIPKDKRLTIKNFDFKNQNIILSFWFKATADTGIDAALQT